MSASKYNGAKADSRVAKVFLSIGSNVAPETNLKLAVRELRRRYGELSVSPVYRNRAVGFDGDDFLNLVVGCGVDCDLKRLSADIEEIHELAGRSRGREKFAARSLDIDILLCDREVTEGPPVTLPREDVLRYAFVLKPLSEIAPQGVHPLTGKTFANHWQDMQAMTHGAAGDDLHLVNVEFD